MLNKNFFLFGKDTGIIVTVFIRISYLIDTNYEDLSKGAKII